MKAKAAAKKPAAKKAAAPKAPRAPKVAPPPQAAPIAIDDNDIEQAVDNVGEGAMETAAVAEAVDSSWDASEGDATDQAQPA
jgi:hypothetical protein